MLITMFLLGLLYVAFAAAIFALLRSVAWLVIIAVVVLVVQFWFSDRIALWAMRGQIVTPEQAPQLHGMVDRLCATANMPKPKVAVSAMDMPNAFATGRSQKHAVLCVTNGMLRRLEPQELEAVLAHELSHVAHRDVAVITIASFIGVLAGLVARFAFYSELFGGGRRNNNDQNVFVVLALVMLVSVVVYAISFLLIRALSRYRELAADRAAAILTGRPSDLASALTKVTGQIGQIPTQDLRTAQAFNAFFFAPAKGRGASLANLLSTHPTLERRLEQLSKISAQLGQPVA
jgi:heat shock protein HtpX